MRIGRLFDCGLIFLAGMVCVTATAVEQEKMSISNDNKFINVRMGQKPLLSYRFGDIEFKPYVKELYTPAGINILLDSPPDHVHHHGLMYAIGIEGVDFWSETPDCGIQEHISTDTTYAKDGHAFFHEKLQWLDSEGKVKAKEKRKVRIDTNSTFGATLVTWRSQFSLPEGVESLTIDGRHYFGLGARFIGSMEGGEFFNSDGKESKVYRGEERLVRSRWCAYAAKDVTVAMFDYPKNARHPAMWFTMHKPFAYLSATLNLHEKPLKIDKKGLSICYGVALWDGMVKPERIEKLYQTWVRQINKRKTKKQEQKKGGLKNAEKTE
ncbi:MAG: DUF6807 family protein [Planctomycetota bacterium]|jgi:hypothetical protein